MRVRISVLFFFLIQTGWAQIDLSPYTMTIESARAFAPAHEEIDQYDLSFHVQQWPVEVLRYTLYRLQNNPYITKSFFIQVTIVHPNKSKKITIAVPVNERYIEAFKTREGFDKNYIDFLSDTFEWMIESL